MHSAHTHPQKKRTERAPHTPCQRAVPHAIPFALIFSLNHRCGWVFVKKCKSFFTSNICFLILGIYFFFISLLSFCVLLMSLAGLRLDVCGTCCRLSCFSSEFSYLPCVPTPFVYFYSGLNKKIGLNLPQWSQCSCFWLAQFFPFYHIRRHCSTAQCKTYNSQAKPYRG